jgi:hypothetical protein
MPSAPQTHKKRRKTARGRRGRLDRCVAIIMMLSSIKRCRNAVISATPRKQNPRRVKLQRKCKTGEKNLNRQGRLASLREDYKKPIWPNPSEMKQVWDEDAGAATRKAANARIVWIFGGIVQTGAVVILGSIAMGITVYLLITKAGINPLAFMIRKDDDHADRHRRQGHGEETAPQGYNIHVDGR